MKPPIRTFALLLAAALLAGCVMPIPQAPTPTMIDINQAVSMTLTADAALHPQPLATTPAPVPPTPTLAATATLPPPPSPTETLAPTATTPPLPTTPAPTPTANCIEKARMTTETIPDDTVIQPGATFEKTWTLQNTGTCTWTSGYTLVFADGERMGGLATVPLTGETPPNSSVTVKVSLTAPTEPGTHRGNWKLADARGALFGLGEKADQPFWVQIMVQATAAGMDLGSPILSDDFNSDQGNWVLGDSNGVNYAIKNGALVMTALETGGETWRITTAVDLTDFYLELTGKTGSDCGSKDSYGVVVRTTKEKDSNFYSNGYVFSIACDGTYRIYSMENGTFNAIRNWTSSKNLKSGPDQTNTIGIWAKGTTFRLFLNGIQEYEFEDETHDQGRLGLVFRADTDGFKALIESIKVWELKE